MANHFTELNSFGGSISFSGQNDFVEFINGANEVESDLAGSANNQFMLANANVGTITAAGSSDLAFITGRASEWDGVLT